MQASPWHRNSKRYRRAAQVGACNVSRSVTSKGARVSFCRRSERLGAPWAGEYLRRRIMHALHDGDSQELFVFYRCHRASLRARLAVAHLLEPDPRTPEKWEPLARACGSPPRTP
jgi:hypothetical protein